MVNKMKTGDYVRIKDKTGWCRIGKIVKIGMFIEPDIKYCIDIQGEDYLYPPKDIIVKSSPNIIELFEEHDLVVIEYYSLRYNERVTRLFEVTYKDNKNITLENAKCSFMLTNNDFNDKDKKFEPIIKSVVTKEQFESMEYKIGEQ